MEVIVIINSVALVVLAYITLNKKKDKGVALSEALKDTNVGLFSTELREEITEESRCSMQMSPWARPHYRLRQFPAWKSEELATKKMVRDTVSAIEEDSKNANNAHKLLNEKIHLLAQALGYQYKESSREVKDTPAHFEKVKKSKK